MPVAAIEARMSPSAATALRRERRLGLADDLVAGFADDFLPGLFLDIGLLLRPIGRIEHAHH